MVREIGMGSNKNIDNSNDLKIYYSKKKSIFYFFIILLIAAAMVAICFDGNDEDMIFKMLGAGLFIGMSLIYLRIILRKEPAFILSDKVIKTHNLWTNKFKEIDLDSVERVSTKVVKSNKYVVLHFKKNKDSSEIKNAFSSNSHDINAALFADYNYKKLADMISEKIRSGK